MSSISFYIFFIFFLAFLLLAINLLFAPSNPYQEKDSAFECGFHSFLGQNRTQFSISFFVFALLFLLFDLEILLVYPYVVSAYSNEIYGLVIMLIFFLVLTLGFAFELGKKALNIDTRQSSPASTSNTNLNVKFTFKNLFASTNRKNFSTTNNKNSFMVTLINLITSFLSAFVPLVLPLYWLFIFYFFDLAKVVNIFNLDFTKTSIYILTYLFYLIVVWLIVLFWDFFISKVLLSKKMVCHLPARFAKYLACKNKSMKIVRCIFTVKYFFTYLLGFSIISIPYLVHYFYTGDFLVFLPADVWPLYILYVSFAFNIARCYIYNIRFISRENLCFFFYSFILLVLTKLTVYFLITLVFISIEQNNKSAKVIDKGDFYFSDTLNKYQEYIDRIVIFSKAFIKAMCNLPYLRILGLNNLLDPKLTSSGPNWHLIKFKYHDLPFNSSKFLSKNPSIPHFDLGLKLRHSSTILNAVSSLEIKCSRLAFTYRGPYIDIYRLSSISCQNLNLDFLHIENIGSFQKSSFSFNVETLRENSNLLLSKTSWKNIENSSVLNNISSIKDKNNLLDCFNLNKDKYGKDPNMDISHLRNPMVYMYKRANDNESIDVSESYEAHSEKSDEKANLEKDLSLVQKLKNQLSHSTKSPEELEAIKSEYEVFFDEESGNNSLEGLEELEEYLNGELSSINKKLNSIEKAKPNYIDALKKKRRL